MAKEKFERTKPHVNIGTIGHVDHGKTTLLDGLLHLGYAAETAYRWSYIAAVLITLAGFALLAVLVFLMMPRNTHSVKHETLGGHHRPRH